VVREVIVTGKQYTEYPDLVPGDITTMPPSIKPGEVVLIPMETINKGTAPATSFFNYFYLSSDTTSGLDDTLIGTQYILSLPANRSITETATLTIPSRIPEGLYYIVAVVDATDVIPESDENNVIATTVPILLTGKLPATKMFMDSSVSGPGSKAEYLRELLLR
jgi:subtilase family serine protease